MSAEPRKQPVGITGATRGDWKRGESTCRNTRASALFCFLICFSLYDFYSPDDFGSRLKSCKMGNIF